MKKFHLFGLAALMVCALASCGGGESSHGTGFNPSTGGESTTQPADFTDADYERAVNGVFDFDVLYFKASGIRTRAALPAQVFLIVLFLRLFAVRSGDCQDVVL